MIFSKTKRIDMIDNIDKIKPLLAFTSEDDYYTKSGYHLITKPFDMQVFRERFPDIDVHKNNPTNLYIP